MTHAPLVCDLAVSVADVLHGRDDAIDVAEVLIGGYVSVTPLEDEEAALLAELVSARLATEVTVAAWHGGLYPDNAAYLTSSEPGARAFLDAIEAMGFDAVARRFRDACRGLPYRHSGTGALLERRRRALPRSPLFYYHPGAPGPRRGRVAVRPGRPAVPRLLQQRARGRPRPPPGGAGGGGTAAAAGDPQPIPARGDRRAGGTAQGHPAARARRRPGRELRQRGQRPRLADRPRGHRAGGRGGERLRLPRADRGHARPVPGGVGQGRAARPCRHRPRARRVPRSPPAGGGRLGGAVRRPHRRRRAGARRPRLRGDLH